jgi:hypothetical protein
VVVQESSPIKEMLEASQDLDFSSFEQVRNCNPKQ